jgi:hypothetical protein
MSPENQQLLMDLFGANARNVLCRGKLSAAIAEAAKSHNINVRFISPTELHMDEILRAQSNQGVGVLTAIRKTLRIQDNVHALVFEDVDEYNVKQESLIKELILGQTFDETGKDFDFVWATIGTGKQVPVDLDGCFGPIVET